MSEVKQKKIKSQKPHWSKAESKTKDMTVMLKGEAYIYDKIKEIKYQPYGKLPIVGFKIFNSIKADHPPLQAHPIDDAPVRVVAIGKDFKGRNVYEIVSGKNIVIDAMVKYQHAMNARMERAVAAIETGDTSQLAPEKVELPVLSVRFVNWPDLEECKVPPRKLSSEELVERMVSVGIVVPKPAKTNTIGNIVPKSVSQPAPIPAESGKFGRIFSRR